MTRAPHRNKKSEKRSTCPQYDDLVEMARTMTAAEIADRCCVAASTVRGWLSANEIKARPVQRANGCPGAEAIAAAMNGRTLEEAAAELRCTLSTLRRWRRELGILAQPVSRRVSNRPSADEWRQACRRHTAVELREKYGVSAHTIWEWSKKLGASPIGGAAAGKAVVPEQPRRDWNSLRMSRAEGINGWIRPQVAFG